MTNLLPVIYFLLISLYNINTCKSVTISILSENYVSAPKTVGDILYINVLRLLNNYFYLKNNLCLHYEKNNKLKISILYFPSQMSQILQSHLPQFSAEIPTINLEVGKTNAFALEAYLLRNT